MKPAFSFWFWRNFWKSLRRGGENGPWSNFSGKEIFYKKNIFQETFENQNEKFFVKKTQLKKIKIYENHKTSQSLKIPNPMKKSFLKPAPQKIFQ